MFRWTSLAVAAAVALTPALSPAVARAAEPAIAVPSRQSFIDWNSGLMDLANQAAEGNQVFARWSNGQSGLNTREDLVAFARRERPAMQAALGRVRVARDKLAAYPAFRGDAEQTRIADALLRDFRDYAVRIEGSVAAMDALLGAIIDGDGDRVQAEASRIRSATVLLVEGQLVMVKARRSLYTRQDSEYFILGAMVSLYEGMAADMRFAFNEKTGAQTAVDLRASAARCREYVAAGRPVAQGRLKDSAAVYRPVYQLDVEAVELGAEICGALDASAGVAEKATDGGAAFDAMIEPLVALENRYIGNSDRQMELVKTLR